MDRVVVIVLPTESAAAEAVKALKQLQTDDSIELYAWTVTARALSGQVLTHEEHGNRKGLPTLLGAVTGALVGLLGGPVGAAIGAGVGGAAGLGTDLMENSALAGDFASLVATHLKPGHHAVIANIEEDWPEYLDRAMAPLGATVLRLNADNIAAAQLRSGLHLPQPGPHET